MFKFINYAIFLFIASCTNLRYCTPINTSNLKFIQEGYTNANEISNYLGAPTRTIRISNGEIWVYRCITGDGSYRDLIISFNSNAFACPEQCA